MGEYEGTGFERLWGKWEDFPEDLVEELGGRAMSLSELERRFKAGPGSSG
ncbi:MAG: hypothetical protein ACP5E4_01970 [Candidatus Aenigmatarchaeota archaeon]